jgi:hypothetical protein
MSSNEHEIEELTSPAIEYAATSQDENNVEMSAENAVQDTEELIDDAFDALYDNETSQSQSQAIKNNNSHNDIDSGDEKMTDDNTAVDESENLASQTETYVPKVNPTRNLLQNSNSQFVLL